MNSVTNLRGPRQRARLMTSFPSGLFPSKSLVSVMNTTFVHAEMFIRAYYVLGNSISHWRQKDDSPPGPMRIQTGNVGK